MEITVIRKNDNRINRKTGEPLKRIRVVAYARVSTDNEEQLNSYESQKAYYKEKIISNPNWDFIQIYADEGISGTQDFKRENFMAMIDDAVSNKFDLILTKSISRFARNTLDTLKYVRLLKEHNIAIMFEEEGINTLEMAGELLLTVLSSVAQQESETISNHVKLGLKMKSERGELVGFNNCYGYSYDSKENKMTIIEEEASVIKLIFKHYIEGHGCDYIAKKLDSMSIKPRRKNKWSPGTILGIIKNEKYVGDVIQGKTFTIDAITHKRMKNYGEAEKYYMKNHHDAIISRDVWDKSQEELRKRSGRRANGRRLGNVGRKYTFSGKMKCGFCGTSYSRRAMYSKNGTTVIWDCIANIDGGKEACPNSKAVRENIVQKCFVDAYNILCNAKDLDIDELLKSISDSMKSEDNKSKIENFKKNIKNLEIKKSRLLDLLINETISEEDFSSKQDKINEKIKKYENKIEQYELLLEDDNKVENGINKIRSAIDTKKILGEFDSDIFETLIDYVIVGGVLDGQKDPCMIRFICKSELKDNNIAAHENDFFIRNMNIENGMSEDFIPVLDFFSNQSFYVFEKNELGRIVKRSINSLRVRLELEK